MALHFHELQRRDPFLLRELMGSLLVEKFVGIVRQAIENDVDVFIARPPWILENLAAFLLKTWRHLIAQPIQSLAQRHAPFLIPIAMASRVASTIAVPAFDAMRTAPCTAFPDFGFTRRAMALQVLAIVGDHSGIVALDLMKRIGERHVALLVMMAVGLPVCGDMNDLRPRSRI